MAEAKASPYKKKVVDEFVKLIEYSVSTLEQRAEYEKNLFEFLKGWKKERGI